jgi:putative inorganic carbon (hco3(-)) transporter
MKSSLKLIGLFSNNIRLIAAFLLSIIFLISAMLLFPTGNYLLWLLPVALLMALLAIAAIDKFLLLIVFLVPVSIQLRFIFPETPVDLFLPTELMLPAILIIMIFKVFVTKEIDRKFLFHPVSVIILCMLGWSLITSLTGTMIGVSLKSFATKLWFIAAFYLLAGELFKDPRKIRSYFGAYLAGMVPVVLFYLIRMADAGIFSQVAAYAAARPFFNDHTSLGAALAFSIPVIIYFIAGRKTSFLMKALLALLLLLFSAAFVFSYSRAAWLSLAVSALFTLIIVLKISWKIVLPAAAVFGFIAIASWNTWLIRINENREESSGNIATHIQSIANVRSDASNMERINRWKAALRMFREKPLLGWGPATYQFKYAPYQISSEKTIISTNWGEGGNAHSEYLGALVDSGIPGAVIYIILVATVLLRGTIIRRKSPDTGTRYLVLAFIAGLVTYAVHGGLNNFLDTDKISAMFWAMSAGIVALDLKLMAGEAGPDQ